MSDKKRSRNRIETKIAFSNLNVPPGMSEKEIELQARAAEATRSSIAELEVSKAAQAVTAASLATQKSLSTINEELANKLSLLQDVKTNIDLEAKELTKLYGARVILEHLDVLKAEHDEQKAALEKEILEARTKNAEDWNATKKEREREQADYEYTTKQTRKADLDAWNEQVRVRNIQELARQDQLQKIWAQREDELKLREKELIDLRAAVAGHLGEIEKAVKQAVAIESNRLTRDHNHAKELLEKDRTSEKALYEADKKALTEQNARLTKLNEELQIALKEANQKNAEIATKALESTSSREALTTLQTTLKDAGVNGSIRKS